jgi:anti-sigma factor RsiW
MRCHKVQQKLEDQTAGELTPQEQKRIEGHLRRCSLCQVALARQQSLKALVANVPAPPLPDGFAERVMAEARQRGRFRHGVPRVTWNGLGWLEPQRLRLAMGPVAALAAGLFIGAFMGWETWQGSAMQRSFGTQVAEGDFAAGSDVSFLTDLGDRSLGNAYLGLTRTSANEGT